MTNPVSALISGQANYRDAVRDAWLSAQVTLAAAKANENALRLEVIALFSGVTDEMASGTETVETGNGKLKIERKLNYKLDNSNDNEKLDKVLDAIEASQVGGNVIAERLVKWEATLKLTEYKLLNPAQKALVDAILTITPAAPTVKFVPNVGA